MVTYYNTKDLVSFGNYLLSDERKQNKIDSRDEMIRQGMRPESIEEMMAYVSDADLANWRFEESIKKSKNFLKTLDVDLDRVKFCTAPNFYFNQESGQMSHLDGNDFVFVELGSLREITTSALKDLCKNSPWSIFYLTDDSKLMTNEMGIIENIRCAFIGSATSRAEEIAQQPSVVANVIAAHHTNPSQKERFIVIPRELFDENDGDTMEEINNPVNLNLEQFTQDINDLIDETCEANGWTRADEHFQILMADKGIAPKASFKIQ